MITPRGTPTPIPIFADGLRPGDGVADGVLAMEVAVEGGEVVVTDVGEVAMLVIVLVDAGGVVDIAFETDESDAIPVVEATSTDEAILDGSSTAV